MSKTKAAGKADEQEEVKDLKPADAETAKDDQAPETTTAAESTTPTRTPEQPAVAPSTDAKQPQQEPRAVTALVLCTANVGGHRYEAGIVLKGLPEEVAQAHAHALDAHPAAVEHAIGAGAAVMSFGEA